MTDRREPGTELSRSSYAVQLPFYKKDVFSLSVIGLFCLYLFRVLEVLEGRHEVYLEFDPWTIKAGTGLTLLTALLFLAFPLFRRVKRKTLP